MSIDYKNQPKSSVELDYLGLRNNGSALWNLTPAQLYEQAIKNKEAVLTDKMALRVLTGKYTGRSPEDRFIVDEDSSRDKIDWNNINKPVSEEVFDNLHKKVVDYLDGKSLYVKDLFCGADPKYRLNVRVVSEVAYHALFAHNMFINPSDDELKNHEPGFTVLAAPNFQADPEVDGTRTNTFILCNLKKKLILIGGTLYSGEVKKGIFAVMNYLLPQMNVMPMHCSANMDKDGKTAVYFGLSGTGKTTLSADSDKILIGDDEHGWSDNGIFNFEGGCYAKTINLTADNEPEIFETTQMPGTILENVVLDKDRVPDFDDDSLTQNTRCAYPISFIPNASDTGLGNHPENIIFLTADAFGVLPPISKLTPEQAMYHFISGYTAKVAGTERGVDEPQATFSACFGSPFMPLHPTVYAELLAEKIRKHNSNVWLVNTGWTGGMYGTGNRMSLLHTRRLLTEAIEGNLKTGAFTKEPVFGLQIPENVDGVPVEILNPRNTWKDKEAYDKKAKELANMFKKNFEQFADKAGEDLLKAGPLL
ncbi:MAG: phosphoenolpyruvate carboxykinase (ATP) [Balneolaceae bacterium]|nr:phosphoenolpyruvate carboxykinase (ATP) [Balneolaceae bacterium]